MKALRSLTVVLLLAGSMGAVSAADWVVVANPKSGVDHLSQDDVINIFLGRYRRLSSGITAEPVDLPIDSVLRARFYRVMVNKSLPEINTYWARLVFSGNTRPLHIASSSEDALQFVARNVGGMAYIERAKADARVKIVFEDTE
jgi:hypothetical protein